MVEDTTQTNPRKTIVAPLFAHPQSFSELDSNIRTLLDDDIRQTGMSREQFCDRMTAFAGRRISLHTLNSWIAPSRQRSLFPAAYVQAFCLAANSDRLRRLLLGPHLCGLLEFGEKGAEVLGRSSRVRRLNLEEGQPPQ